MKALSLFLSLTAVTLVVSACSPEPGKEPPLEKADLTPEKTEAPGAPDTVGELEVTPTPEVNILPDATDDGAAPAATDKKIDAFVEETVSPMEEMTTVLEGIETLEDAMAAKPQLEAIAAKYAAQRVVAEEFLESLSAGEKAAFMFKVQSRMADVAPRLTAASEKIMANEQLKAIVNEAMGQAQ